MESAINLAGWFVSPNKIITLEEFGDGSRNKFTSDGDGSLKTYPTILLLNGGSASASEILAAALREQVGAKLVGEKSFGKGTIQDAKNFSDGSGLHLTIAKWLTPKKEWIHKIGLIPDVEVLRTDDDVNKGLDKQLDVCLARAKAWVDFVNDKKGNTGNFGPFGGNNTLCAAGGLMRIYTGSTRTDEQLRLAVEIIVRQLPGAKPQPPAEVPDGPRRFGRPGGPGGPRGLGRPEFVMPQEAYYSDMAYLYYGTLLTFQWGGPQWTKWNDEMKKVVLANLSTVDGPDKGSWNPEKDPFGNHWGRAGATAIGVLCLEVYYRYERILK